MVGMKSNQPFFCKCCHKLNQPWNGEKEEPRKEHWYTRSCELIDMPQKYFTGWFYKGRKVVLESDEEKKWTKENRKEVRNRLTLDGFI